MAEHSRGGASRAITTAVALLTVSDTRTPDDDRTGAAARRLVTGAGHTVHDQTIVPDDPARIRPLVESWLDDPGCGCVVTCGGTGIASRDRTYEALAGLLDRRLDGFGELFRMLSWDEVGAAAMLSRAVAGIARGTPLFVLPGSTAAVELALGRLVLPELGHILSELRK